MTALDAAEQVLRKAGTPLHYNRITELMLDSGLWTTKGKTPWATVNARIATDINHRGEQSRFRRVEPCVYELNTPVSPTPTREPMNRGSMTALDAAAEVLRDVGKPLHIKSITDRMIEQGLWKTTGKTPWSTVGARICSDLAKEDGQSRFRRVTSGVYGLNESSAHAKSLIENAETPNVGKANLSLADAAERVLRMHSGQEPLHYHEITRRGLDLGLVTTTAEVPAAALNSSVSSDILRRRESGRLQRFVRSGAGLIGLAITDPKPKNEEGLETGRKVVPDQPSTRNHPRMTALNAAAEVLREAGMPLHIKSITDRIIERGLWKTNGKTPWWSVNSRIGSEIANKGERSRFRRVKRAVYEFNGLGLGAPTPVPTDSTTAALGSNLSYTDAAERILRQNDGHEPLHFREIARRMLDLGLIATRAVTPAYTLSAAIGDEIRGRQGANQPQRFVRLGRGLIGLAGTEPESVRNAIGIENKRVRDDLKKLLRSIDPGEFEHFVRELFSALGAERVELTQRSGDGGMDVRGTLLVGGAIPIKIGAQVKRWKHIVDSPVVNETRGSLGLHDVGLVVTTGRFSHEAQKAARIEDRKPITLIDGAALVDLMVEHEIWVSRQQHDLLTLATPSPDRTTVTA